MKTMPATDPDSCISLPEFSEQGHVIANGRSSSSSTRNICDRTCLETFVPLNTLSERAAIHGSEAFMSRSSLLLGIVLALAAVGITSSAAGASNSFPAAASDAALEPNHGSETAVLSGGCFWGVQAVFQHVKGVLKATSGYAGGTANNPNYEQVSTGSTGHAESVEITFDPSQVTYGQLLRVFFSVAHDPTELNRQGPDEGTQYRSAILYTSDEQKRIAEAYIAQLTAAKVFP